MQFNSNEDFPTSHLPPEQWETMSRPPVPFDQADPVPCACITTRVLIRGGSNPRSPRAGDIVKTVKGVLIRTPTSAIGGDLGGDGVGVGGGGGWSDSSDDDSESSDDDDMTDIASPGGNVAMPPSLGGDQPRLGGWPAQPADASTPQDIPAGALSGTATMAPVERAYWLRRTLRTAIYGQVRYGVVLRKLNPPLQAPRSGQEAELVTVEWEATEEAVAIKEMSWEHIRAQRDRLAEDPIKEVAAMQYLRKWLENEQRKMQKQGSLDMNTAFGGLNLASSPPLMVQSANGAVGFADMNNLDASRYMATPGSWSAPQSAFPRPYAPPQNMVESHIMMPYDLLTDNRNLYSIMPYCKGGELFDVLERKNRFTEPEARYWMRQILKGLACLKEAGVTHRDMSLENLLVHEGNVLVIDMGMCLRIPYADEQKKQRFLILPQGTCGKWHYMSPEICKNRQPFDGHAVDLWATGVILFLMLTGFPPWERPVLTDERFKYMTNGYLVQMLTEWQVGLSADAMDLLQRMFWLDPTDRLSLEQVWAHPWMMNGIVQPPY